jgi:hypothetical protein
VWSKGRRLKAEFGGLLGCGSLIDRCGVMSPEGCYTRGYFQRRSSPHSALVGLFKTLQ